MNQEDALKWGNAELTKMRLDGMMRFRAGRHSSGRICVDLITQDRYPDHVAGLLLDYRFADTYRNAVGRMLLKIRMRYRDC